MKEQQPLCRGCSFVNTLVINCLKLKFGRVLIVKTEIKDCHKLIGGGTPVEIRPWYAVNSSCYHPLTLGFFVPCLL